MQDLKSVGHGDTAQIAADQAALLQAKQVKDQAKAAAQQAGVSQPATDGQQTHMDSLHEAAQQAQTQGKAAMDDYKNIKSQMDTLQQRIDADMQPGGGQGALEDAGVAQAALNALRPALDQAQAAVDGAKTQVTQDGQELQKYHKQVIGGHAGHNGADDAQATGEAKHHGGAADGGSAAPGHDSTAAGHAGTAAGHDGTASGPGGAKHHGDGTAAGHDGIASGPGGAKHHGGAAESEGQQGTATFGAQHNQTKDAPADASRGKDGDGAKAQKKDAQQQSRELTTAELQDVRKSIAGVFDGQKLSSQDEIVKKQWVTLTEKEGGSNTVTKPVVVNGAMALTADYQTSWETFRDGAYQAFLQASQPGTAAYFDKFGGYVPGQSAIQTFQQQAAAGKLTRDQLQKELHENYGTGNMAGAVGLIVEEVFGARSDAGSTPVTGTVVDVDGKVMITRANGDVQEARKGMRLHEGDSLSTVGGAAVSVADVHTGQTQVTTESGTFTLSALGKSGAALETTHFKTDSGNKAYALESLWNDVQSNPNLSTDEMKRRLGAIQKRATDPSLTWEDIIQMDKTYGATSDVAPDPGLFVDMMTNTTQDLASGRAKDRVIAMERATPGALKGAAVATWNTVWEIPSEFYRQPASTQLEQVKQLGDVYGTAKDITTGVAQDFQEEYKQLQAAVGRHDDKAIAQVIANLQGNAMFQVISAAGTSKLMGMMSKGSEAAQRLQYMTKEQQYWEGYRGEISMGDVPRAAGIADGAGKNTAYAFQKLAKENGYDLGTRPTQMNAASKVSVGEWDPKPAGLPAKSIDTADVGKNGVTAADLGKERYQPNANTYIDQAIDEATGKPATYVMDKKTGKPLEVTVYDNTGKATKVQIKVGDNDILTNASNGKPFGSDYDMQYVCHPDGSALSYTEWQNFQTKLHQEVGTQHGDTWSHHDLTPEQYEKYRHYVTDYNPVADGGLGQKLIHFKADGSITWDYGPPPRD